MVGTTFTPSMRAPHINRVLTLRHISAASSRRVAAATSSLDASATIDDTLDAPHRLGASSTLPGLSSPCVVDAGRQQTMPPLPEPILYDGPSGGARSRSIRTNADILPTSLPPPKTFDGPAIPGLPNQLRACAPVSRHVSCS